MSAEERIRQSRVRLLARHPFFATLAMELRPHVEEDAPPARISGDGNVVFDREFLDHLSDAMVDGLLVHEVLHPALGVFERLGARDPELANRAHDYLVNLIAREAGFSLPADALIDDAFSNLAFEEVYQLLSEENERQRREQGNGEGNSGPDGDKEESSTTKVGSSESGGRSGHKHGPSDGERGRAAQRAIQKMKNESWGIGQDLELRSSTPDEKRRSWQRWREALALAKQAAMQAGRDQRGWGDLPGMLRQAVDEIIEPRLDWRSLLSRWLGERGRRDDYTYRRPSRRGTVGGVILPSMRGNLAEVAILIDTSGSMGGDPIAEVIAEVATLVDDLGCAALVVTCDAAVHEVIREPETIDEIVDGLSGGGGSDFRPAFEVLERNHHQGPVIAATDGWITVPEVNPNGMDVLWLLPQQSREDGPASWGEVIHIEE